MNCSTPGFPVHHQLPEPTQTHVYWVGDAIQPSHPLLSPSPPAFNHSQHQVAFSNESALHIRWPNYWSFNFSISPSSEYWGLISFRIDWIDLLAVQGVAKSWTQLSDLTELNWWNIDFSNQICKREKGKVVWIGGDIFVSPQNSHNETLTPNVIVFGDGDSGG